MAEVRRVEWNETGNLHAELGSRSWAIAVRNKAQSFLYDERSSARHLKGMIDLLAEHHGYRSLDDQDGSLFPTFEAFCRARPPFGLGYDLDALNTIIEERKSAQARAQAPKPLGAHRRPTNDERENRGVDNTSNRGDSADYLTARIARDHPVVLERMRAGEFSSVRAAALEAGIVRRRVSVAVDDPDKVAAFLAKHFDLAELRTIFDLAVSIREGDRD